MVVRNVDVRNVVVNQYVSITGLEVNVKNVAVLKYANMTRGKQYVKNAKGVQFVSMVKKEANVRNVGVLQYVSITRGEVNVKNVGVLQSVSTTDLNHHVLIVKEQKYVNQDYNHTIQDVGHLAIENYRGSVVIALQIFSQKTQEH